MIHAVVYWKLPLTYVFVSIGAPHDRVYLILLRFCSDYRRGLVIGFIEHLQNVTINNYVSLTELNTPKITVTTAHIKPSQFFPNRCSVAASNGGRSPYSGFPNCPRPQLQHLSTHWLTDWLTHSLTHSLTHQPTTAPFIQLNSTDWLTEL
jgi:hypothetical protein